MQPTYPPKTGDMPPDFQAIPPNGAWAVSVIIPARNAEETIGATLSSLREQGWLNWNAIIVDDGSTDRTRQIALDYVDHDPRFSVVSGPGRGAGAARNVGLALATGDWILFLDADDTLHPEMMARMMGTLQAEPTADAVHCGWTFTDWAGVPIGTGRCAEPGPDLFPVFARYCALTIHACIFRRALLATSGGFDESYRTSEDFDLWQRIARLGARFVALSEHLVFYRLGPKTSWFDADVFLPDVLRVVRQGHGRDGRLPLGHHDAGQPISGLHTAEVQLVAWAAAIMVAHGEDPRPLLDKLPPSVGAPVDSGAIADSLLRGLPLALAKPESAWGELWPRVEANLRDFLEATEKALRLRGLANGVARALEHRVAKAARSGGEDRGGIVRFGATASVCIEVTSELSDLEIADADRAICFVFNHGHDFGDISLPVFNGRIPAVVIADAIAARFAWPLLNSLFSMKIYPELTVVRDRGRGWVVERRGVRLASGLSEDPRAAGNLHDTVGWIVFMQELLGLPGWGLDRLYDASAKQADTTKVMANGSPRVAVELAQTLPTIMTGDQPFVDVEVLVGGASAFLSRMAAKGGRVTASALRSALLDRGKMELARIAVREAIVGFRGDLGLSLNLRLRAAAGVDRVDAAVRRLNGDATLGDPQRWAAKLATSSPLVRAGAGVGIIGSLRRASQADDDRRAALPSDLMDSLLEGLRNGQPLLGLNAPPYRQCLYLPDLMARQDDVRHTSEAQSDQASQQQAGAYGRHFFEVLFSKGADPWKYSSPYEQTKYEQTLSLIPRNIGRALEIGCAEGHFTRQLAPQVRELTATDISDLALARAAERCRDLQNVAYQQLDLIADEISGRYDLIVCSELLYYMGDVNDLAAIGAKLADALQDGGCLVTAHANLVVDDPHATGFDWRMPYGAKVIGETFSSTAGLTFETELQTPLYRVQRFRKSILRRFLGRRRGRQQPRAVIEATHADPAEDVARGILWGGGSVEPAEERVTTFRLPILMYHAVSDHGPDALSRWRVTPEMFAAQMEYLRSAGFQPTTLAEWRAARLAFKPLDGRRVLITFDDGYVDFEANVLPVLQHHGLPALLFVPTEKVGQVADWDAWSGTSLPLMDWNALRRLRDAGISFGSHGMSHLNLAGLSASEIVSELWGSRARLERELGVDVDALAYPSGSHDAIVEHLAAACGYRHGLTIRQGPSSHSDPDFGLARIEVAGQQDLAAFIAALPA